MASVLYTYRWRIHTQTHRERDRETERETQRERQRETERERETNLGMEGGPLPLIPALRRQKQAVKTSLVCVVSFRPARTK